MVGCHTSNNAPDALQINYTPGVVTPTWTTARSRHFERFQREWLAQGLL
jgi:hypothetical protein